MRRYTGSNICAAASAGHFVLLALFACFAATTDVYAGGVRGYVFGLNAEGAFERPLQGATVEFLGPGGGVVAKATTNAAGYYQVELTPGVYRYRVSAPGYQTDDAGRQIAVQFADRYVLRNFGLRPGQDKGRAKEPSGKEQLAILTGHVFEERDGRRIGIPGARIVLRGAARTYELFTSGTPRENAGAYRIALPPGTYAAAAHAEGFAPATARGIELRAGQTTEHDFILRRLEKPKGVLDIKPRIEPPPSRPVPGNLQLWVRSLDAGGRVVGPLAGSLGGTTTVHVDPGRYLVLGHTSAGQYRGQAGPVVVGPGQTITVDLLLSVLEGEKKPVSLLVRVLDQGKRPVPGARVLVRQPGQPLRAAKSASTNAQGDVSFGDLEPGKYQVLAQKEGYKPAGQSVELSAGATRTVNLVLQRESSAPQQQVAKVTGYVVYPSERSRTGYFGVAGARIEWTPLGAQGRSTTVETRNDGRYEVSLPVGRYMARVLPPDRRFGALQEIVDVPPGESTKFFVLRAQEEPAQGNVAVEGYVGVRVPTALGQIRPVPGVRIQFQDAASRVGARTTAVSDQRGAFRVQLPPGNYIASVAPPPGYRPRELRVRVTPGMRPLVIELEPGGQPGAVSEQPNAAVVEVVQSLGPFLPAFRSVPGAAVRIYAGDRTVAAGKTDGSGRYQVVLPPGVYRVVAEAGGQTGVATLVVRNGGRVQVVLRQGTAPPHEEGVPDQPGAGATPVTIDVVVLRPGEIRTPVPVTGATVLFRSGGEIVKRGTTDKNGRFTTQLSPGRYLVVVRHSKLGMATANIVVGTRPVRRRVVLQNNPTRPIRPSVPIVPQ